jgi:hypothetical protein
VIAMADPKRASKLLIYDSRHYLYCVYRARGEWSNPNSISLIGANGDGLTGVLQQVRKKFRLSTETSPVGRRFGGKFGERRDQHHLDIRPAGRQPGLPARRLWRAPLP